MHYRGAPTAAASRPENFGGFDEFETGAQPTEAAQPPVENPADLDTTNPLWGLLTLPSWLLLQGDYRHMTLYKFGRSDAFGTFPMQADVSGQLELDWFRANGSIGLTGAGAGSPHGRRAQLTTNQGRGINLLSRTHWLGADFGQKRFTARAGRIDIPFGMRMPEHTMWVRDATRTDRESDQQHGVALAYSSELIRGEALVILGNYQIRPDRMRERGYSAYAEVRAADKIYAGVSSLVTHAGTDFQSLEDDVTRQAHGLFARTAPVSALVILAEGDVLLKSRRDLGYVGFLQLDLALVQGLHFGATGELLDAGYLDTGDPFNTLRRIPGFGKPRFGGWLTVDWFFFQQLEARLDAVARQNDPFTVMAQLHILL
jgi:hypothetical protein